MKHVTSFWKRVVGAGVVMGIVTLASADPADDKGAKPKPYPLQTCVVSGEKFGGDMGAPHVFTYQGREIKLCCKSCLKDFNKDTAKFIKKLDEAEKAKAKTNTAPSKRQDGHGGHQH